MKFLNTSFLKWIPIFMNRGIFLILFFIPSSFYSQFYQIQNLNSENGLASPEVYGVMQDSKGYIWVATDMGVSRYNGTEFKNFSTENGLPDNTIFGFCEDTKNRIWFRSFSGKLSYFLNDSIYSLPCNPLLEKENLKYYTVLTSIYVDEQDTIWVGLNRKSLLKISPPWQEKNVSWITSMENGGYVYLFKDNHVVSGGNFAKTGLITVYNPNGGLICQVNHQIKDGNRFSTIRLKNGTFAAAINNVLFNFSKDKILDRVELQNTVNTILEDRNGNIISANYDGISIHHGDHLNTYETIPDFKGKVITGIVIDKENTLWFGAEGQGIYNIPYRDARYYTIEHGLIKSKISCIVEKDGNILTGHLNGMMSTINGNVIKQIDFLSNKFNDKLNKRVNCIYIHNNRDIYVFQRHSSFKLDANFESYKEIDIYGVKKITKSRNGLVWVLTPRLILLCDIDRNFKIEKEIPFNQYIDEIFEDSKGTLWICALNGLWNFKNNSLQYLGEKNPLLNTRIVNVLEDGKGRLWMATRGKGVIIKSGNLYKNLTKLNGLASNMCRNQLIDSENNVWIGSNNGISKISIKDSSILNYQIDVYSKKQGLSSNEVNYILKRDSNLIIAHNTSISIIKASFIKSEVPPLLYFTKAINNNHIYKNDTISFLFNNNYLKLFYEVVSFKNQGDIEYKYKMDGLDTNWVYTTYATAQFQALLPGKYTFSIYAKNNDGYWSQKPAVLHITVLPLWYQTWVFKITCFLVLIVLIFLIVKMRIDVIKKREYEKTELQNKIASTELKALRAQMNPHFIFNAINSVQYFMTNNDPASSQKYLSKFAKLIRYVLENSKPSTISLDKEIDALKLYIDLEILRFENHFEYEFILDENINASFIQIPSILIQTYVENAIWHGLMHKKNGGKLMIKITMKSSILTCIIEDNGIGRVQTQKNKTVESLTQHKSFGMAVTMERIEIISRLNNIAPEVNVIDLYENNLATGTRVEIKFPSF